MDLLFGNMRYAELLNSAVFCLATMCSLPQNARLLLTFQQQHPSYDFQIPIYVYYLS